MMTMAGNNSSAELRSLSAKCRCLADEIHDKGINVALMEMATEFSVMADGLANRTRRGSSSEKM